MNVPLLIAGAVLVSAAVVDQLWTTLWVDGGAGPLSSRLSSVLWRGFRAAGRDRRRMLSLAGPVILVATFVLWITLVWIGWTLVFASGENVLVDTQSRGPVTWFDRVYFVGYTTFTLGIGDFVPSGGVWQIATTLTTATGMLFITMGVSYVVSVVGAVVDKRSFAGKVSSLGRDGHSFVRTGWNGEDFHDLDLPLNTLVSQLDRLVDQHKAYPILHYYQPTDAKRASTVTVVVLDEALTLLRFGVPERSRPNVALVESAHSSTGTYLDTLSGVYIYPSDTAPPRPDLDRLREGGIPTRSEEAFEAALRERAEQRRKLLGMIETAGWDWSDGR